MVALPFPAPRLDALDFLRARTPARFFPYRQLLAGAALTTAAFALLALYGRVSPVAPHNMDHVPYCEALQGGAFALWHLLTAATIGLLVVYLRSERGAIPSRAVPDGAVIGLGVRGSAAG